jgi:hypothetical protein
MYLNTRDGWSFAAIAFHFLVSRSSLRLSAQTEQVHPALIRARLPILAGHLDSIKNVLGRQRAVAQ